MGQTTFELVGRKLLLFLVVIVEGYNLAAKGGVKAFLDEFDGVVGLHYLKAVHLNDSKGAARIITHATKPQMKVEVSPVVFSLGHLGCHLDRHEDIGKGQIGISAFRDIVNEPRLDNIPLILETPGR